MKEVPFKGLFLWPMTRRWQLKVAPLLCSGHTPNCHFLFARPAAHSGGGTTAHLPGNTLRWLWNRLQVTSASEDRLNHPLIVLASHVTSQTFHLACTELNLSGTIRGLSEHFLCGSSCFLFFYFLKAGTKLTPKQSTVIVPATKKNHFASLQWLGIGPAAVSQIEKLLWVWMCVWKPRESQRVKHSSVCSVWDFITSFHFVTYSGKSVWLHSKEQSAEPENWLPR